MLWEQAQIYICIYMLFLVASAILKYMLLTPFMVQVLNCHDCVIYVLAPLKYATIYGCSDATIVLGAVGKVMI